MNCPRCVRPISHGQESCVECGFSLTDQDAVLGSDAVYLERVTDAAGCLRQGEAAEIEKLLVRFEADFPQLFFVVYVGALTGTTSLRQLGFWLLNRAAISALDITRPNENGAILIINTNSSSAALVAGYFLECYVGEEEMGAALRAGRRSWQASRWKEGIAASIEEFSRLLRAKASAAARNPERYAPKLPDGAGKPKFLKLREPARPLPPKRKMTSTPRSRRKR